jgi:hypothetical protein
MKDIPQWKDAPFVHGLSKGEMTDVRGDTTTYTLVHQTSTVCSRHQLSLSCKLQRNECEVSNTHLQQINKRKIIIKF